MNFTTGVNSGLRIAGRRPMPTFAPLADPTAASSTAVSYTHLDVYKRQAYILQHILENQKGYKYLDSAPTTVTAKAHRPAYGSDGDYFSKPNAEDIYEAVFSIIQEAEPKRFA